MRAAETLARVSRGIVCGHETERGRRGPAPELCPRCRRYAELATRLRQAATVARELGETVLAIHLAERAELYDPRRPRLGGLDA